MTVVLELAWKMLEHLGTEWEVGMILEQTFIHVQSSNEYKMMEQRTSALLDQFF